MRFLRHSSGDHRRRREIRLGGIPGCQHWSGDIRVVEMATLLAPDINQLINQVHKGPELSSLDTGFNWDIYNFCIRQLLSNHGIEGLKIVKYLFDRFNPRICRCRPRRKQ